MAPLAPIFLALFSLLATPALADHWGEADVWGDHSSPSAPSYSSPSYGSSNLEPQQDVWRREAAEADQRNREATERRNQPPTYESSPANPNAPFGVFGADGSYQVCQRGSGNNFYCF